MIRLYVGDTLALDVTLNDDDGQPLDLTDAVVDITVGAVTGPATIVDPPTGGHFTFSATMADSGIYTLMYRITWSAPEPVVRTVRGDSVRVVDPADMWATVADVEAIFGPQDDPEAVEVAIDAAMALIFSWLCEPVPDPLPPQFTMATALVAGRLVQAPAPGSPVAETIGDYSYRLATGPTGDALRAEVRQLLGPWLCGTIHSVRVWPASGGCGCEAGAWAWQLYLDCFEDFQPDAEGLLRS